MTHILQELSFYLSYPFVRYALIVGVLIALCSSLLGVTLVLKRFSFIGDGLSHVAFGAMAVATIFKLVNNTIFIMPVTIIAAVLLLRTGQNTKIKGDAAIAMLSVSALAVGYLVMNIFSTSANVGSLLISALIIFPALSAMRVARSFKGVVVYAAILSVIGAFFGIVLSILCSTPVGATIVILDLILFFINCIIGKIMGR